MNIGSKAYKVLNSIPYLLQGVGLTLEITLLALIWNSYRPVSGIGRVYGAVLYGGLQSHIAVLFEVCHYW